MKRCPICARAYPAGELFCSVHGLPLVEDRTSEKAAPGDLTGTVLDERYRLGGVLGTGGMGVVYEAEHLRIGRRCAVKVLPGAMTREPKLRMRFFQEVRATSRIRHPNVVEILDYGEHDRVGSYMVMEFLDGTPLSWVIEDRAPLPIGEACAIAIQLCAALGATHAEGLLHRDLKPANVVVLPNGQVKVLDFGLVKPVSDESLAESLPSLTTDGIVVGTPCYMSPEQWRGEAIDARADVYALGVILYEMLVGRAPFDGASPIELMNQHLGLPVPSPATVKPEAGVPPSAEVVLLKALAKHPEARYRSMAELADSLFGLADELGFGLGGHAASPARPPSRQPAPSDGGETRKWIRAAPLEAGSSPPAQDLHAYLAPRRAEIVESVLAALLGAFPRYRALEQAALRGRVDRAISGVVELLGRDSAEIERGDFSAPLIDEPDENVSLTESVTALWLAYTVSRPLMLQAAGGDLARYASLSDRLDSRLLPYFFGAIDTYVSFYQGRLQQLADSLRKRNDELQDLRQSMEVRVAEAGRQLAGAERLKARVLESITSGLVLLERDTRRVLLWNPAMERLSGIRASQVVGRPLAEIAHHIEGIPFEEFAEQIRYRQEVGLRKLRLRFGGRELRTVYIAGQPFFGASGEREGTLFSFDDVTEREQIIESLGRYLSQDLVERILLRGGLQDPEAEQRRAVVLSAGVRNLGPSTSTLSPRAVAKVLNGYVRAVARSVFQRGGNIDRIAPDGLLAYFTNLGSSCEPAVEAAVELVRRLQQVSDRSIAEGGKALEVSVGLHVGEVLVLDVGGERFMVRTVVGEAAGTAEALRAAAARSEVLLSPQVAAALGGEVRTVPGPVVQVPGQDEPIRSLRLRFDPSGEMDEDPDTLVADKR